MNLITNAADAIEGEGRIVIKTRAQDDGVTISVKDSGVGIPDEVKSEIFVPFFTTKDVGKGTGLGLSISYGIIEKHGGHIDVDSVEGEGTTFTITLPTKMPPEEDSAEGA